MAPVPAAAGLYRDAHGGAAVAGQPASGAFPQAVAGDPAVHGVPDHADFRPRFAGEGPPVAAARLVVGARVVPGDRPGTAVLGTVAFEAGESPRHEGDGSWLSSTATSAVPYSWRSWRCSGSSWAWPR